MNRAEWKAVYDYCNEYNIPASKLLVELKNNGTIDRRDTLEDLGRYVNKHTYDAMIIFLEENL